MGLVVHSKGNGRLNGTVSILAKDPSKHLNSQWVSKLRMHGGLG